MNKEDVLKRIDTGYLRDLLLNSNNSPRYNCLLESDQEILAHAKEKFNSKTTQLIFRGYMAQRSSKNLAQELREKNGKEIAAVFKNSLPSKFTVKTEVKANNRICDLVYLDMDGNIHALEIKANGDKISNAASQCSDYSKWADFVHLVIAEKKLSELKKVNLDSMVGILVYYPDRGFITLKKAQKLEQHPSRILDLMVLRLLKRLAVLWKVSSGGKKREIRDHLKKFIGQHHTTLSGEYLSTTCKKFFLD